MCGLVQIHKARCFTNNTGKHNLILREKNIYIFLQKGPRNRQMSSWPRSKNKNTNSGNGVCILYFVS